MWMPFIVFSFDEAHDLTDFKRNENWSTYFALRRCLGDLVAFPFFVFLLFISTTGEFRNFFPETLWDLSSRISWGGNRVLSPITEIVFSIFLLL